MARTEAENLEEFTRLCMVACERRQVDLVPLQTIALRTIRYGDFEVVENPLMVRDGIPVEHFILEEPFLYLDGEVKEDGIHLAHAKFDKGDAQRVIDLLQSAYHLAPERQVHVPHPLLAHPFMQGDMWSGWTASGGTFEQDLLAKQPYAKAAMDQVARYLPDAMRYKYGGDTNIAVLGCGEGIELAALANLPKQNPSIKLLGIDQDLAMLRRLKGVLPKSVDLKRFDLRELTKHVKPNSLDMVVAVGLFDMQTLDWDDGVRILSEVRRALKDDGYGIFVSYGIKLFLKAAYEQSGFEVKRCSNPKEFFIAIRPESYVVQKKRARQVQPIITNSLYAESEAWRRYPRLMDVLKPIILE